MSTIHDELAAALEGVEPYMTAAESAGLTGDEGCHWPVEAVRHALARYRAAKEADGKKIMDDGGPAFPFILQGPRIDGDSKGMSLRDWFAGQALPVIITALDNLPDEVPAEIAPTAAAKGAYEMADAMLAARQAQEQKP